MKRVISLYLPTWPTDRLRRHLGNATPSAETPLILAGSDGRKRVVMAADVAARKLGIRIGMSSTQAQAMLPDLRIEKFEAEADRRALEKVAHRMLRRFSPVVALDEPDGLMVDATGVAHLFGGEEAMMAAILSLFKSQGVGVKAAMAATYGAAYAMARQVRPVPVIEAGADIESVLSDVSIEVLRLSVLTIRTLKTLGIETIGELTAQPRAAMAQRFGQEIGMRLDQLAGRRAEPFRLVELPDIPSIRKAFAEPIATPEAIHLVIGALVEEICRAFEGSVTGARRLDLLFHRIDNTVAAIRIGLAKPERDVKRLVRLLTERVVTIDPGFGIEAMTLSAPWTEPLAYSQNAASFGNRTRPDIGSLIDTLRNRLGPEHVFQAALTESDVPERSSIKIGPEIFPPNSSKWETRPRPIRLLPRPEPVETMALLPDHPPISFTWRGTRRKVRCADGPERLYGEWWMRDAELEAVRDYFRVEDESGERFWLYRAGDGMHAASGSHRWFLHGFFG